MSLDPLPSEESFGDVYVSEGMLEDDWPILLSCFNEAFFLDSILPRPLSFSSDDMLKIRYRSGKQDFPFLIRKKDDNKLIGNVSLQQRGGAGACWYELGYWISPDFTNRGLASKAARTVIKYFLSAKPVRGIFIMMRDDNMASRRVAEKSGVQFLEHAYRTIKPLRDTELVPSPIGHNVYFKEGNPSPYKEAVAGIAAEFVVGSENGERVWQVKGLLSAQSR